MYPGAPNPIQIQFAPSDKGGTGLPPLILIHDSSGTTFGYFALGHLGRDVWAIHDPHYWEASAWEGGIDGMASHYIQLIEAASISGPVVLGGWSFGGYVAIAMARMLATRRASVTTNALLLGDSPYILSPSQMDPTQADSSELDLHPTPTKDLPDLVLKSMDRADTMLENWNLPTWGRDGPEDISGPPPTLLVRCKRYVNSQGRSSKICLVDLHRHEKLLGWENGYPGFIKTVIEVDADHYNIFDINDSAKMESLTDSLKEALASISLTEPKGALLSPGP